MTTALVTPLPPEGGDSGAAPFSWTLKGWSQANPITSKVTARFFIWLKDRQEIEFPGAT